MPTPTFTSVTATKGPVGGDFIVKIVGTNFKLPPVQTVYGPTVPLLRSVSVKFGGEEALMVDVLSTTELVVSVPPYRGIAADDELLPVAIRIANIDLLGVEIVGEYVVESGAFTYIRPAIHDAPATANVPPAPYTAITAALITMFRRQVFANVVQTTHVDYAEPGIMSISVSKIPAIILQGPAVARDLERTHNEPKLVENVDGTFSYLQPPTIEKLSYTIIGVSDNERELVNIMGSIHDLFHRLKYIGVDVDPNNAAAGRVNLVLQLMQDPQITSAPSESNIRTFVAVCEIRGVEIYQTQAVDRMYETTAIEVQAQQVDGATVEVVVVL